MAGTTKFARLTKKRRAIPLAEVFASGFAIATSTVAIPFLDKSKHPHLFVVCLAIAAGVYIRTLFFLDRMDAGSRQALLLCLALAAVWRVPLLIMPPTLSTDVYR
jgi:hypothetical protein